MGLTLKPFWFVYCVVGLPSCVCVYYVVIDIIADSI